MVMKLVSVILNPLDTEGTNFSFGLNSLAPPVKLDIVLFMATISLALAISY